MEILKSAVILVIGFVLLIKGADYFVEGSSSVAKKFKVPSLIIGMTIVAMGTSLPELAVSVTAAMAGNNTLAVSNVAGSNIFNLMVVCGACALFAPLAIEKNTLMKEFPFSILCAGLLVVMGYLGMSLGRVDGVILRKKQGHPVINWKQKRRHLPRKRSKSFRCGNAWFLLLVE